MAAAVTVGVLTAMPSLLIQEVRHWVGLDRAAIRGLQPPLCAERHSRHVALHRSDDPFSGACPVDSFVTLTILPAGAIAGRGDIRAPFERHQARGNSGVQLP